MIPEELQPEILLNAYAAGIFPMADRRGRIEWFSPHRRGIIELNAFSAPRSLRQRARKGGYDIRINTHFEQVIRHCSDRAGGTWISPEITAAYCRLHQLGFAHSVETFYGDSLAGGLYGVSLGGAFFGESMFTLQTDGSKLSLLALVERMKTRGMMLLDIQFLTPHLKRFGACEIPQKEYMTRLRAALHSPTSFID